MNPMWMAADIADEIQSYENPLSLHHDALRRKISRILQRGTIKDRSRCGAPRTVRIEQLKKAVKREASIVKYPSGVMFWGAITTKGLILQDGPINFTQWLRDQCPLDKRKRMYMTGDLYAKFLREEAISTINEVVENLNEVIFQDDQDSKHRTKIGMDVVNDFFEERIEPNNRDAKFADV
ncbi:unnamed protein product [Rotaria sordida]|uniref:Uncharacterized protein n=1 Tax=Rotaria sordida TaxID=392033 RepID=A0A815CNK4_9BILA|nr:unnamed protein product [Rotaria sordida]CAF1286028.1 unnamed protein product [Rotaria sordida]CAF1497612.1 unnamed protein product [Rotaria sordida]CAF1611157.1 unnamed protein product [Rotaria sordida]CAF3859422.1 unnamed protein product [Rotaria sordida]